MSLWRMRIACWMPKATNTRSEYVILTVFPRLQWLHKRPSMLRYTFLAFLVRSVSGGNGIFNTSFRLTSALES
jgi:hypothetical protein